VVLRERRPPASGARVRRIYAHTLRFSEDERARLTALLEGREWAPMGTNTAESVREDETACPA
jgi:hypothetical protein